MSKNFRSHLQNRSFGPLVFHEPDQTFRAACTASSRWCIFLINSTCTHTKPARKVPDPRNTPDWCAMRESALRDVADHVAKQEKRK